MVDGKVRLGLACAVVVVVVVVEARAVEVPVPGTGKDSGGIHTGPNSWLVVVISKVSAGNRGN